MPCLSTGPKIVCACPNFLCQTKIHLDIVPVPNLLGQTKRWFEFGKFSLIFSLAQNIWTGPKHFGTFRRTRHHLLFQLNPESVVKKSEKSR